MNKWFYTIKRYIYLKSR